MRRIIDRLRRARPGAHSRLADPNRRPLSGKRVVWIAVSMLAGISGAAVADAVDAISPGLATARDDVSDS